MISIDEIDETGWQEGSEASAGTEGGPRKGGPMDGWDRDRDSSRGGRPFDDLDGLRSMHLGGMSRSAMSASS